MRYKILELLKQRNDYVSGEEIGARFNVSRAAIWKNISKLKIEGYNISSVTNRGYLIKDNRDIINSYEIMNGLNTKFMGKNCIFFSEIDSTNDEAKRRAESGEPEGTIVIAEKQLNGKGRYGRSWISPKGENIYMSTILKPHITPREAPQISLVAGISACNAIKQFTGLEALLKWPNDIILNGKKIAGILIEMNAEIKDIKYIIMGIGINVNTDEIDREIKYKATSLKIETGKNYMRRELAKCIIENFEKLYEIYIENSSFKYFIDEYKKYCINLNKRVKVIRKNEEIKGEVIDVTESGDLLIRTDEGEEIDIFAGEVSVRLDDDKYI